MKPIYLNKLKNLPSFICQTILIGPSELEERMGSCGPSTGADQ